MVDVLVNGHTVFFAVFNEVVCTYRHPGRPLCHQTPHLLPPGVAQET